MAFWEVPVFEVREVLRLWLAGHGFRAVERLARVDRKTVRRHVAAAEELGLVGEGGEDRYRREASPQGAGASRSRRFVNADHDFLLEIIELIETIQRHLQHGG